MLENNFGSNFCLKIPTAKIQDGTRTIYMRVTLNRPRDTIPAQICHSYHWDVQAESKIKHKKASTESRFRLIVTARIIAG
ncbi:hypothetical protein DYBT9623_04480 [Dyadobacter sp. CECT 9623]|uniref:Arm DNA-binding domain-containing protein n=1 Tax=Dyadobacter linearis TaxID=2823330 RepID=A0ABN7RDL6_9BACT|nr:hypothetical protein DYBT9623_04480 [Dyadobacter sp. CECT 9623]